MRLLRLQVITLQNYRQSTRSISQKSYCLFGYFSISIFYGFILPYLSIFLCLNLPKILVLRLHIFSNSHSFIFCRKRSIITSMGSSYFPTNFWWWLRHWSGVLFLCRTQESLQKTRLYLLSDYEEKLSRLSIRKPRYILFSQGVHAPLLSFLRMGMRSFFIVWKSGQKISSDYGWEGEGSSTFTSEVLLFPSKRFFIYFLRERLLPLGFSVCILYNNNIGLKNYLIIVEIKGQSQDFEYFFMCFG